MSASLSSASYKSTDYRCLKHQMKNILNPGHCFRGYESRTGQWVVPTRNNFKEIDVGPSCPEGTSCCHGRWRSDSRYVTPFSTSAIKFTGNVRFPNICQKLDVIWMHTHKSIPVFHGQIYTWHVLCKATSLPACQGVRNELKLNTGHAYGTSFRIYPHRNSLQIKVYELMIQINPKATQHKQNKTLQIKIYK